jgi:hypothetical protein
MGASRATGLKDFMFGASLYFAGASCTDRVINQEHVPNNNIICASKYEYSTYLYN